MNNNLPPELDTALPAAMRYVILFQDSQQNYSMFGMLYVCLSRLLTTEMFLQPNRTKTTSF